MAGKSGRVTVAGRRSRVRTSGLILGSALLTLALLAPSWCRAGAPVRVAQVLQGGKYITTPLPPGTPDELKALKSFHGHLGPNVTAGLRMGKYALKMLKAERYFGMEAEIMCPGAPPGSCFLDGIQFSTGCTMGKMNIRLIPTDDKFVGSFLNKQTQKTLMVRLRPEAIARATQEMKDKTDVAGALLLYKMTDEELFEDMPE